MPNNNLVNDDQKLWKHYQINNAEVFASGHLRQDRLYKKIKKSLPFQSKLLEIGFGDGYLLQKLSQNYNCYGADITSEVINRAQQRNKKVKFKVIETDGKLPYKDNFFDGIIASEVLEHMDDKEIEVSVSEFKRILKPGGLVFLTFPADEKLEDNMCYCSNCGNKFHKWGHKQSWNDEKIKKVFKEFEIMEIKKDFVRYEGHNFLEKIVGFIFYIGRKIFNYFNSLSGKTYFIILKNKL